MYTYFYNFSLIITLGLYSILILAVIRDVNLYRDVNKQTVFPNHDWVRPQVEHFVTREFVYLFPFLGEDN